MTAFFPSVAEMVGYSGAPQYVVLFAISIDSGAETPDDFALLARVADDRDPRALEQLYDKHSRVVYSVLLRMTRDQPSSEELCQEVFLRLWKNAGSFDGRQGSLTPWLLTIARNAALDRIRSKGEKQRSAEVVSDQPLEAPSQGRVDTWVDTKRQADKAIELMDGLPNSQRQALELAYFEGLSQSEIADKLGAPLGTVKSWVRGALGRLREQMGGVQ